MKNLKSVEDFVLNAEFRDWVTHPTPAANIFWEKWIEAHPEKKENFREAVQVIQLMARIDHSPDPKFTETIWDKIESKIDPSDKGERETVPLNIQSVVKKSKKRSNSGRLGLWLSFAASILLLFTSAYFFFPEYLLKDRTPESITSIMKSNPKGQKSTIMLPDGTTVILNSESSLVYTSDYNKEERRIRLRGEAYFKVSEDPERPFKVETDHLVTTALGTSFNVNAYRQDKERVTLVEGKIRIERNGKDLENETLVPGEMIVFEKKKGLEKTKVNSFDHLRWKDGIIVFQDTPLTEAMEELEKWYGVEVELRDFPQDYNMNFTGTFDNDNLRNVLLSLSYSMSFEFEIDEKKVMLNFK